MPRVLRLCAAESLQLFTSLVREVTLTGRWWLCVSLRVYGLLLGALSVSLPAAEAQTVQPSRPGYEHRVWTTRDGLPQNLIRAILQTQDGFLWIGTTNGGLVRFDGLAFTVFNLTNTPELASNWVEALYEDADGTLWIGTVDGLVRYAHGAFTRENFEDLPEHYRIQGIQADRHGRIWVASSGRVARRDSNGWTKMAVGSARPTALLLDRSGIAWIGTEAGLVEWRDRIVRTLTVADGLPADRVQALYEDASGQLWIGTSRGLARLDRERGTVHAITGHATTRHATTGHATTRHATTGHATTGPLATAVVNGLYEDRQGVLWIGSAGRLFSRTRDGAVSEHAMSDVAEGAQIGALTEDREGHLWFGVEGGRGGLHRLRRHHVRVLTHEQGLPCDNVGAMAEGVDGTIWVGPHCEGGGVSAIRQGRTQTHRTPGIIGALLAEPDGTVWAGDWGGQLLRFERGEFVRRSMGRAAGSSPITALHRDSRGALWVGRLQGLFRYADGQWIQFGPSDGLANDGVRNIVRGRNGTVWIGLSGGLAHYDQGRFTMYTTERGLPRAQVRAIHVDAAGSVWIGTYGGGLCRLKSGRIACLGTRGGLLDTSVHSLIEDAGYLWMSGDGGIRRASLRDLDEAADGRPNHVSVVLYDDADGMKSAEANGMGQPAGLKTRDGSLWFPTQVGVARVDPAAVRRDNLTLHPVIEHVAVNGAPYAPDRSITAPAGATDLEVRYTAPGFARPEQIHFKYRLLGRDAEWIDAGTRRVAFYTNLPPGSYRFEIMARSSGGIWSEPTGSLALVLPPRLDQRLAFKIAMFLVGLAVAAALVRLRDAQLRQRARKLEALVSERTAELSKEREELNAANQELGATKADLQRAHTQLLSVLDQLRVGVIIVDASHEVLFVSEATRRLLVGLDEHGVGQPLDLVLPISPEALRDVQALMRNPPSRTRLTVQLHFRSGQKGWTELDARPDPRDESHSILYLYDVTETYELKRVQEPEAQDGMGKALTSLIGLSVPMRYVQGQIRIVAAADTSVLIEGETGTGKELVARAIHEASRRKHRPFVAINCAGLTESLLASQLFGHRRGAFTGAVTDHVGLFEAAQGGTLLLDEIGDMPMSVQTHLLRVLQEREILRLGDSKPRRIDVRVLAATHRSLDQEVANGNFREDLLYRIVVVRIALPPLRLRHEDIPLLATAFMERFCIMHEKRLDGFSRDAMEHLMAQRWPGNVRELRAAIEWAVLRATGPTIRETDLPVDLLRGDVPLPRSKAIDEERRRLVETLTHTGGNRSEAARLLGVSRSTLYRRLAIIDDESADGLSSNDD